MDHKQLLSKLIEIKSFSGEETNIRSFIAGWYAERGIDSLIQGDNLIVHFEGLDRSKAFIFNSHMDTVSPGDKPWRSDPWIALKKDNKLIGLGASDMKSGLAASMLLAEKLNNLGKPPVDMWFTYVVKEEEDGSGTDSFINWFVKKGYTRKYQDLAAIFTEPTDLKEVEHGHRGNYFILAKAEGPSGHASRPHELKGVTAVRTMINFADSLQESIVEWDKEFPSKFFRPAITVGEMTSIIANARGVVEKDKNGAKKVVIKPDSPNKFADTCRATFDVRTTPESHKFIYKRVNALGKKLGIKISLLYPAAPAGFTDPSEKIVQIAKSTMGKRKLTVSLGSADLGFVAQKNIKAVILGPGQKRQCHKGNEYCFPEQIPQAVEVYQAIVEAWAK